MRPYTTSICTNIGRIKGNVPKTTAKKQLSRISKSFQIVLLLIVVLAVAPLKNVKHMILPMDNVRIGCKM